MIEPLNQPVRRVYVDGSAVVRLADLGLRVQLLHDAVLEGDKGRQMCTSFHPRQAVGHRMWSDTLAGLRRRCVAQQRGWTIGRRENFETVVHETKAVEIAVVGGDEFTGYLGDRDPRVKRKRGPETTRRVHDNLKFGMQPLPSLHVVGDEPREPVQRFETWFYLIRATEEHLWLELSCPVGINDTGYVSRWSERIVLPRLAVPGGVTPIDDNGDDDSPFTVTKK